MSRQVKSTLAVIASRGLDTSVITYSRASQATRTNEIGVVELVDSGKVRLDFESTVAESGKQLGWLLEQGVTNLCLQSADMTTTWSQTSVNQTNIGTITSNNTVAPDSNQVADEIKAASSATGIVAVKQGGFTFTNTNWYTVSVWAKKGSNVNFLEISNKDNATAGMTFAQTFNLNTGATGASGGTVYSAKIKEYPANWYRCSVTFQAVANTEGNIYFKARNDNAVSTTGSFTTGDGFYLWGAQVENVKYMTSYVPTTTATVARAADVMSVADTDDKWNWDIGTTLLIDARPLNSSEVVTPIYHYAAADNEDYFTMLSDGKFKIYAGNANQLAADPFDTGIDTVSGDEVINIMAVTSGRMHMAQNGVMCPSASLPDTSFTLPTKTNSSNFSIKFFHGTGHSQGSGHLVRFEIFSRQLSDNEIANTSVRKSTEDKLLVSDQGAVADGSIGSQQLGAAAVSETRLATDAVTTAKIKADAVTNAQIATDAVTLDSMADNSVAAAQIVAGSITGTEIAANAITSAHIAVDVIVAADLAANSITVSEISNLAVTDAKLAADSVITSKILDANVTTVKIADGNITSAKIGAGQINASHIADGTVVAAELADDAVTEAKILNGAVTETKIGGLQVTSAKLAADSVTDAKLADHASLDANRAVGTNHIKDLNITAGKIAANAVTEAKIIDGAITSNKIPAGTITAAHIANGTVVEQELANNSVTADKLADNAVDTNAIVNLNVTRGKLAADVIDGTKIADDAVAAEHIADNAVTTDTILNANVTGAKLANGTVGTTQLAADSVTDAILADHASLDANRAVGANHIKDGAVTASKISAGTITAAHIADGTVVAAEIADNAVEEAKIKDGAVTTDKIADNAITTNKIAFDVIVAADLANNSVTVAELANDAVDTASIIDANVTTAKIADANVTSIKIADLNVTNAKLANNAVTAAKITAGTITGTEIANDAVTGAHIAMTSDARGDILYYNGTDYARLAKGTSGHVLTMGANDPAWAADSTNVSGTSLGGGVLTGTIGAANIAAGAVTVSMISASGSAGNTTFLRGDGQWAVPAGAAETDPTATAKAVTMAIALG